MAKHTRHRRLRCNHDRLENTLFFIDLVFMKASLNIGFLGILTLIFVVFKLLDKIDWSWWLVLSPVLIAPAVILLLMIFYLLLHLFESLAINFEQTRNKFKRYLKGK